MTKPDLAYHADMLVGRETEQRQIDQLLQQAAAGSSGVLVLRGDPGIGKTALADYAAGRARILAVRGRLALLTGQMVLAQRELAESAGLVGDTKPLLAVELFDQAVSAALEAGLYDEASRAAERMARLAERSDETARFLADLAYGGLAWLRGEAEHGMSLIRRAMSRLEANPVLAARPERQLDLASAWCDAGRPDRAWLCPNRAVELARSEGAAGRLPRALRSPASAARMGCPPRCTCPADLSQH